MKRQDILNREVIPVGAVGLRTYKGKVVALEQENETILYIGHETEEGTDPEGNPVVVTRAFAFPVPNPVTRAKAIDAAERAAYGLHNADEVASFNAALARKAREGIDTEEVREHDDFIGWVKLELDGSGLTR